MRKHSIAFFARRRKDDQLKGNKKWAISIIVNSSQLHFYLIL